MPRSGIVNSSWEKRKERGHSLIFTQSTENDRGWFDVPQAQKRVGSVGDDSQGRYNESVAGYNAPAFVPRMFSFALKRLR